MVRSFSALAVFLGLSSIAALAAALAPSTILADAASYDGKAVTVAGKVQNYQHTHTMMGTVAGYQLCDTKCVVVVDEKNATHQNGDTVTVSGTFHVTFKAPKRSFNNAVVIK